MKNILHLPLLNSRQQRSVLSSLQWWMIQLGCIPARWLAAWLSRCSFIQVRKKNLWNSRFFKEVFFSLCAQFCAFGGGEEGRCQTQSGMGECGGVLGKDKWEWGMGRRGLCSANGSCAFPRSGRSRLLLTMVPLHCNYLQWRYSCWERGQQNSRQRGIKSTDWQDGGPLVKPFSAAGGFSTECLYDLNHPMWVYSLLDYLVYENRKRVTCQGL